MAAGMGRLRRASGGAGRGYADLRRHRRRRAQAALAEAGIRLLGGVQGRADEAVGAFWPARSSMIRMSGAATTSITARGMTAPRTAATPVAATATG